MTRDVYHFDEQAMREIKREMRELKVKVRAAHREIQALRSWRPLAASAGYPAVQLTMLRFNHTGGSLGADEIDESYNGYFEWDRDASDTVGSAEAAGVTVLNPSAFDDPCISLDKAGLYRLDLQVTIEDETSSPAAFGDSDMWTSTLTTLVSGHDHNYDRWNGDDIDPCCIYLRSGERESGSVWDSTQIGGIYISAVDLLRVDASHIPTFKFAWLVNATADDFELYQALLPFNLNGMTVEIYDEFTTLIIQRVGDATT